MRTTGQRLHALMCLLVMVVAAGCADVARKSQSPAAVVESLKVDTRKPAFAGTTFGEVGAYEFVSGVATLRIDPAHPANSGIVDLLGAAGPDGLVRYRTDVAILRPVSPARASGMLVVEIVNRGNKLALARLADGATQFDTAQQAGQGWFMRQGHTLAWIGWQGDVPLGKAGQVIGTDFPVVRNGSQPVTGLTEEEFIFDNTATRSRGTLTYPVVEGAKDQARLLVKGYVGSAPTELPRSSWRWLSDSEIEIDRPANFDGGAIFTLIYTARDPRPMGLGFAAIRDVTTWLQDGKPDAAGQANLLADLRPKSSILFGISQSGRFLRDYVWEGFNESPNGGRVFDGGMALIAGSRKSFVNARFAQPGRYSRQHEDHFYPGDQFPFTYAVTTDSVTGRTDGIFARCTKNDTCPKLMHLDSNLEFWQARASLVTLDAAGRQVSIPDNVRLYLMGSTQHGPAAQSVAGICQQPNNTAVQAPLVRATMARLIDWTSKGTPPPNSRYPMQPGDFAKLDRAAIGFPDLSPIGVKFPAVMNELAVTDPGAIPFRTNPTKTYVALIPRTNADGHDLAAVLLPDVGVPLATYSGWGLRRAGFAEGNLCGLNGIQIALAPDAAKRRATGDPRPSIEERYGTRAGYVRQVEAAGRKLQGEGFLLSEDVDRFIERARSEPRVGHLAP
jgi:hypothetical protein